MIENLMILGKRILELRKRHSMTQEKLANEMGVSIGAVSKWETGASIPDLTMLCTLADFFHVSTDYLLGRNLPNHFLICDDSTFMGGMVTDMMHHLGYSAKSVENSNQLFQALETALPYGIFLDVHFPDENGLDILKRLKKEYPNLHVVMLTADTSEEVHSLATEYGADYFIYKPFSFEHLQAAIKSIL